MGRQEYDNVEGWEGESMMTDEEKEEWDEAAESVWFMLVKVGSHVTHDTLANV